MITLVIGGIRSGKSRFACQIAKEKNKQVVYIATCVPLDDETVERVEKHRASRPKEWLVIEEPVDVAKVLLTISEDSVILIECLTLWVSNLLLEEKGYEDVSRRVGELVAVLSGINNDVIVVSNEVGLGGISPNKLARVFTDIMGETSQLIGSVAEEVYTVTAGIPIRIK
ncbi:bifunctional adenosylcobinamide kinase/adenosylcobinamide-phosphate guanylyltransferase [bacterium]|nr:bifunctional adenosylcobinamide kinase/adenosylcobinamide-phosphate guanylyltransferase [bacterium]MBU1754022.1 bifunctional adenosylcobinamide kinase/adenosylcobinamide-phosphate guanylyltransferase [bacterium]